MKYTVWFEIYGKKLKTTVDAQSAAQAVEVVRSKVVINKVEPQYDNWSDIFDMLFGKQGK